MASTHWHGTADTDQPHRLTYGTLEVAGLLGISDRSVRILLARGEIPSVRLGGRRLVRASDLDAYVTGLTPAE